MTKKALIYCAIDTDNLERAIELSKTVGPVTRGLKLGLEFFNSFGPQGVEKVRNACPDADIFLDLKFHDIPNTVAAAVKTISINLAPAYLNIHATGGVEMMQAARQACVGETKLLAVTILTSLTDESLHKIGYRGGTEEQALHLAKLAQEEGIDGIVCSAHEIETIRKNCGPNFILMVPGIRPAGSDLGDQKRVTTPREAIQKGATHLVIGRPVTGADDPVKAAQDILDSLK